MFWFLVLASGIPFVGAIAFGIYFRLYSLALYRKFSPVAGQDPPFGYPFRDRLIRFANAEDPKREILRINELERKILTVAGPIYLVSMIALGVLGRR